MKPFNYSFCIFVALGLSACNATQAPPPQASVAAPQNAGVTAPGFKLPEGAGCSNQIARYQAVMDNDKKTGHVSEKVYDQINGEIARAASACQNGKESEAMGLLRASKARHGYPG